MPTQLDTAKILALRPRNDGYRVAIVETSERNNVVYLRCTYTSASGSFDTVNIVAFRNDGTVDMWNETELPPFFDAPKRWFNTLPLTVGSPHATAWRHQCLTYQANKQILETAKKTGETIRARIGKNIESIRYNPQAKRWESAKTGYRYDQGVVRPELLKTD